jgi:negative regulator of flagellin synthesis FlgM
MSEINNIKTNGQIGVTTPSNVKSRDNRQDEKASGVQLDSVRTDTVSLTDKATQLQSLQQALADTPVVNSDKVSALRAAIADGSYTVDAKELAQNMINFETKLR